MTNKLAAGGEGSIGSPPTFVGISNPKILDVRKNKRFQRKVKPLSSDEICCKQKIAVGEKGKISSRVEFPLEIEKVNSNDKYIVETLNNFFVSIVPSLKTPPKEIMK